MTSLAPALVALGLVALAVPQAVYVLRDPPLPDDVALEVLPTGYSYGPEGDRLVVGFQLLNPGPRVAVTDVGTSLPGLRLVDVVASGAAFDFRAAGEGPAALPEFTLDRDEVVVLTLVYTLEACSSIPADARPVPVRVQARGAQGSVAVPLPALPSDEAGAPEDRLDEWQQVLSRSLCR